MSQRVAKVESLIQQVVAMAIASLLDRDAAAVTVTRVDAAPDLRNATVWIGLLGEPAEQDRLWERLQAERGRLQDELGRNLSIKYVPRLHLRRDTGGEYAANIDRLLKDL